LPLVVIRDPGSVERREAVHACSSGISTPPYFRAVQSESRFRAPSVPETPTMNTRATNGCDPREFRMQIAVTGATGFLQRYLVRYLLEVGHELRCWYRPESDRPGFEDLPRVLQWLPGTLGDEAATRELVRGVDAVVHAAVQWQGPRTRGAGSHG